MRLWLALCAAWVPAVAHAACIGSPKVRRDVLVAGRRYPLTIEIYPWETSEINTHIARIILEEVMGYNVSLVAHPGGGFTSLMRIAGCSAAQISASCCNSGSGMNTFGAPTCPAPELEVPDAMANVELWLEAKDTLLQDWADRSQRALDLGSVGLVGRYERVHSA